MAESPGLLFSAFEPSGDALAADTITALLRLEPGLKIYALGGPKMEAAGAVMLEHTTQHGTMFLETLVQAWSHHRRVRRISRWLRQTPMRGLVPVDSPAGNWSICKAVRRTQPEAKIVHLVAPQLWAWAPWRIRRLRRLTDHVLCLLPFEQQWLTNRGVKASFVGHPAYENAGRAPAQNSGDLPAGRPRLALLPGSRQGEVRRNWPTMLEAFRRLAGAHPQLHGVVAALDERAEAMLREAAAGEWPARLTAVAGRTEHVLDWCDLALVASGTVTLQLAARLKPMVVMYNVSWLSVLAALLLVKTKTFTLPNLMSEWAGLGRVVPELVPHHGQVEPVVRQLDTILSHKDVATRQRDVLAEIAIRFGDRRFTEQAPRQILATINGKTQ
ncbi:MAG: lipid-A-disaccharide synthase [Planctomycetota bacterium]|jgi:lipid-A-disaccharide synthase